MTKIKAKVELNQNNDRLELKIHAPYIQRKLREFSKNEDGQIKHKYNSFGMVYYPQDYRLDDFIQYDAKLLTDDGKPNLLPLVLRNHKTTPLRINTYSQDDIKKFTKEINTRLCEFYNYVNDTKPITKEWLQKALDYYHGHGYFTSRVDVNDYSIQDLMDFLKRHETEAKVAGLAIYK